MIRKKSQSPSKNISKKRMRRGHRNQSVEFYCFAEERIMACPNAQKWLGSEG